MGKSLNSLLWYTSLLVALLLSSIVFLPIEKSWVNYVIVFIYLIVLMNTSSAKNFITLLVISLTYGFGLTYYCFKNGFPIKDQIMYILLHLFLSAILLLLWLLFDRLKRILDEGEMLKLRVRELEKYNDIPHLLSINEFINQATILITGLKRRKEESYLLKLNLVEEKITNYSVIQTIARICIDTIRINYDIITRYDDNTLLIFLQNTNQQGTDIVLNRIKDNIKRELVYIPYSVDITTVETIESAFKNMNLQVKSL
ncbi:hypothetical protein [Mesobacillus jeotgali]|uniref:hypothetical protein n=1 Tax=Mesobacillus jeotgali TaxID=129985 RepID=UPI0009A6AB3E|nr:hypothetical protein [Mesobacillus jeotgali]